MQFNTIQVPAPSMPDAFNALCRITERFLANNARWKGLEEMLREVPLFRLPGDPAVFLPKTYTEDQEEFHNDHFFLPFHETAIQDDGGVVMLSDLQENQVGLSSDRHFFVFVKGTGAFVLLSGITSATLRAPNQFRTEIFINKGFFLTLDESKSLHKDSRELMADLPLRESCADNVGSAMQEVMLLNTPSRFIVESVPGKVRDPKTSPKIPRVSDRPTYTLMTPGDIRSLFALPPSPDDQSTRHSPAPHARRRHFRTLKADRFAGKKGQVIEVKASWVGADEAKVNGKQYRIRLDL